MRSTKKPKSDRCETKFTRTRQEADQIDRRAEIYEEKNDRIAERPKSYTQKRSPKIRRSAASLTKLARARVRKCKSRFPRNQDGRAVVVAGEPLGRDDSFHTVTRLNQDP